jgi:zinc transport system substrate-binding protein
VAEGTGVRIGLLDPLGANLWPGPDLYPDLLRGLAEGLANCLG